MANSDNYVASVSAVNWFDASHNLHIRVYTSDGNTVTERCMDQGNSSWTTGAFSQPGVACAATAWVDSAGSHIRVYVLNDGITEWCMDPGGSWTQGSYTPS